MSQGEPVRTPLFDEHVRLDGNIVDFHGFELPIWYSSIKEEHMKLCASFVGIAIPQSDDSCSG